MIYTLFSTLILILDNIIKKRREENTKEYELCNGNVHVMTYHNDGAFMNLGEKKPAIVKYFSIALTLLISCVFLITLTTHGNRVLKLGLSILLGGAFSNTYDRMKKSYVVDYINFPKAPFKMKNMVFNISDFAILIGSLIVIIRAS